MPASNYTTKIPVAQTGRADRVILEAFAGPGGISEALRMVLPDVPALGIEKDPDACATAEAAGHERLQADVSMLDLRPYVGRVVGFCAGPPCQSFSAAGRGLGKLDKPRIVAHIERIRKAGRWLHYSREGWHDPRSPLVLEVLRYALTLRPEWIVLEQVPAVLPLWELIGDVLRDHGWHVETKALQAEQYGVPQTRKRAILAARWCSWHEDGAHPGRLAELPCPTGALLPVPTHRPYRKGVPQEAGDQSLLPWVSMADALEWPQDWRVDVQRGRGITERHGERPGRYSGEPAPTIRAGSKGSGPNLLVTGAPTITGGHDRAERQWLLRSNYSDPGDPTGRGTRSLDEPALTVTGKVDRNQLVQFGNQEHSATRSVDEPAAAVRVSVQGAAVLQSFRPDYPWRGSKSAQYRQVGDSAPPVLMAAIIASLTKR